MIGDLCGCLKDIVPRAGVTTSSGYYRIRNLMAIINQMGNSCVNNGKDKKRKNSGDDIPDGTDDLREASLPFLDFELVVSNIELRQPPPVSISIARDWLV